VGSDRVCYRARYKVQGTRHGAVQVYRIFKRLTLNADSHIKAERKQKKE